MSTGRSEGQDVHVSEEPEQEAQSGWHASQVELDEAKKPVLQEEVHVPLRRYWPEAHEAQYVVESEQVAQDESHAARREQSGVSGRAQGEQRRKAADAYFGTRSSLIGPLILSGRMRRSRRR